MKTTSLKAQMFHMFQEQQNTSHELCIVLELQGTKYRYCMRKYRYRWYR